MYKLNETLKAELIVYSECAFPTIALYMAFDKFHIGPYAGIFVYNNDYWAITKRDWPEEDYEVTFDDRDMCIKAREETAREAYTKCNRMLRATLRQR